MLQFYSKIRNAAQFSSTLVEVCDNFKRVAIKMISFLQRYIMTSNLITASRRNELQFDRSKLLQKYKVFLDF